MIDLIVLGQIPGTSIYLSFNSIFLIAISACVIMEMQTVRAQKHKTTTRNRKKLIEKAL